MKSVLDTEGDRPLNKEELRGKKISRKNFFDLPRNEIYVVLDSLKCAHNVGTILRLCDSLLVKKVFICGDTIIPPNPKIKQGSRGAEKWVDWEYEEDSLSVVRALKEKGVQILAAEVSPKSISYEKMNISKPVCLVMGREYDGVSKGLLALADFHVHLPLYGMANSLNVSTAASVLLYEIHRQIRSDSF